MKNMISVSLLATCLGVCHFAYAGESSLVVENNLANIEVSITTDLNCQAVPNTHIFDVRYTSALDENPIRYNQGLVKAAWKNCAILPHQYFEKHEESDHSKIYLTLLDIKSGDQFIATIQTSVDPVSREIHFSGYHAKLDVTLKLYGDDTSSVKLSLNPLTLQ